MMANRIEGQIASDWSFVLVMRNIFHRHEVAHAALLKTWWVSLANGLAESRATKDIQAAVYLYDNLQHGIFGKARSRDASPQISPNSCTAKF